MAVGQAPAPPIVPPSPAAPPPSPPRRARTALPVVAVVAGAVLLVAAGLWALVAPGQLVKYADIDQTAVADGQFILSVDPTTGLPLTTPQTSPLHVEQRIHSVDMSGSTAVIDETDTQTIGSQTQRLEHQYVIDRSTLRSINDSRSWAFTSSAVVDRSPAYTVNLPFDTGAGPYPVWMNEVAASYDFTQQGGSFTNDGITVIRLHGHLASTPVTPGYVAQLAPLGLPASATLDQLKPQLKAVGLDVDTLLAALQPVLTTQEQAALQQTVGKPIPLTYSMTADTSLLVEPTTGGIVSLEQQDQTVFVSPDLTGLAGLVTLLTNHGSLPAVQQVLPALGQVASAPPTKVFEAKYAQTPVSVQAMTDYTRGQADSVNLVRRTVPLILLVVGVVVFAAGIGMLLVRGRRRVTTRP